MRPHIIEVASDFWNIRGSFKLGGLIDIGTQASLVRRDNGRFVFLDSYALTGEVEREVLELLAQGIEIDATATARIDECDDLEVLFNWLTNAVHAHTLFEVFEG